MKALPGLVENPKESPHLFDDWLFCVYCDRDYRDQEHEPIPCPRSPRRLPRAAPTPTLTGKPYKNWEKRKLTPEQVARAKAAYANPPPVGWVKEMAKEFGVSRDVIRRAGRAQSLYAKDDISGP